MQYRRLGRTGLQVSVLSLGSGGPNQFGQIRYASVRDIHSLVGRALDLGINYFDTAISYSNSEILLAETLRGLPRDRYVLSSKISPVRANAFIGPAEARQGVERSLRRLGVDCLDILFLHKVKPEIYPGAVERLLPTLRDLRAEGKIRCIGISESSKHDVQHSTLRRALQDDHFDAIMVNYQLADDGAAREVLPLAQARDVGVVVMTAARHLVPRSAGDRLRLFARSLISFVSSPPQASAVVLRLREAVSTLLHSRPIDEIPLARGSGQGFLALPAAGYTFALSHPAVASVLTGTTNPAHLEQNVAAALAPALTAQEVARLRACLR